MFIETKDLNTLMAEALERLDGTVIEDAGPGSVVRLLLAVINSVLEEQYQALATIHLNSYVSTASGDYLDLLGELVHCERLAGEPDDEYRYRIAHQALADATANTTAIRLAALSIDGVKDVVINEYALGAGSCAVYCVIDDPAREESILENVKASIESVRGCGIRVEVLSPDTIPVGLKLTVIFKASVDSSARETDLALIESTAADYLNSRYPGQEVKVGEITAAILDVCGEDIAEVHITGMTRNGVSVPVEDQGCRWNERFVEDGITGVRVVEAG